MTLLSLARSQPKINLSVNILIPLAEPGRKRLTPEDPADMVPARLLRPAPHVPATPKKAFGPSVTKRAWANNKNKRARPERAPKAHDEP